MAPAPKITTASGNRRRIMDQACTPLPKGSISEACTGVTFSGIGMSVDTGAATRSANAPGRLVPYTSAVGQTCGSPSTQASQTPHEIVELTATTSPAR